MNSPILITKTGLTQLQTELSALQNVKRPQLVERLSVARSMGDLSENSDYQSAKEDLVFMDTRIDELDELIKNSKIAAPASNDTVSFGHLVKVKVNSTDATFQIVGETESNPKLKKISHSSPLGLALMGKKIGDKVEVEAPIGKLVYTIVEIK